MIQCTPMYVTNVQRDIGVISCKPPLYRQDHKGSIAAIHIQRMWRAYKNMVYEPWVESWDVMGDTEELFPSMHTGAFHYGYHSHVCATKIQSMVRGYQAKVHVPMIRMTRWIVDNLITPNNYNEL